MVLMVSTAPPCPRPGEDREDFRVYLAPMQFVDTADDAPNEAGAYALVVALDAPFLASAGRRSAVLAAGRYIYCGSARGPGGLPARLGRHMRRGKARRWHIDQLTEAGRILGAWIAPGGDECALVAALAGLPVPLDGFGSSDCPRCRAHLMHWPEGAAPAFLGEQKC